MLWTCAVCTTCYAASLAVCPHCGSAEREEDGPVPKITKAGGPSHEDDVPAAAEPVTAPVAVAEPDVEPAAEQPKPKRLGRGRG